VALRGEKCGTVDALAVAVGHGSRRIGWPYNQTGPADDNTIVAQHVESFMCWDHALSLSGVSVAKLLLFVRNVEQAHPAAAFSYAVSGLAAGWTDLQPVFE
jgi:hypothetical protein